MSPNCSFYGALRVGGQDLGEHFCELVADPYSPRDMRLVVHVSERSGVNPLGVALGKAATVHGPGIVVVTDPGLSGHAGSGGSRLAACVASVETTAFDSGGDPASTFHYGYSFPLTVLTQGIEVTRKDSKMGLIRSKGLRAVAEGRSSFEPPGYLQVELDGVQMELGSSYEFEQGGEIRYPNHTLTRVSTLSFSLPVDSDGAAPHAQARHAAAAALRLLSVFDRDRLRWVTEGWFSRTAEGQPLCQRKTVRWVPPPRLRSRFEPYSRDYGQAYQSLVQAYGALGDDDRATVDTMCAEFEVAATSADLETSLVRWHSVIDFACKRSEKARGETGRRKTKRRIIDACDEMGVDLVAIVGVAALTSKNKGELSFTSLRNQFIHDGFDVFEGRSDELVEGVHSARALAERMLLATLRAAAPLAHIGTTGPPH